MRHRMLNGGYAASRCERTFIGSFVRRSFWKVRLSRRARALRKFPSYRQYRRWNERALCKFEEGQIGKKGRTLDAKARPLASSWTRARFARSCIARREVKWKFTQASNRDSQCEAENRKHKCQFSRESRRAFFPASRLLYRSFAWTITPDRARLSCLVDFRELSRKSDYLDWKYIECFLKRSEAIGRDN